MNDSDLNIETTVTSHIGCARKELFQLRDTERWLPVREGLPTCLHHLEKAQELRTETADIFFFRAARLLVNGMLNFRNLRQVRAAAMELYRLLQTI